MGLLYVMHMYFNVSVLKSANLASLPVAMKFSYTWALLFPAGGGSVRVCEEPAWVPGVRGRVPAAGDWRSGLAAAEGGPPHDQHEHQTGPRPQNLRSHQHAAWRGAQQCRSSDYAYSVDSDYVYSVDSDCAYSVDSDYAYSVDTTTPTTDYAYSVDSDYAYDRDFDYTDGVDSDCADGVDSDYADSIGLQWLESVGAHAATQWEEVLFWEFAANDWCRWRHRLEICSGVSLQMSVCSDHIKDQRMKGHWHYFTNVDLIVNESLRLTCSLKDFLFRLYHCINERWPVLDSFCK